jgi:peroxiredoxin
MRTRFSLHVVVGLLTILLSSNAFGVNAQEPSHAKIGEKIPNLTFKDEKGKTYRLYELENKKAIVIVFLSFDCPVAKSYAEPLSEMAKEFGKHGVTLWGLTTNEDETIAEVAKQAKHFNLTFPVFKDERLRAADALQADVTPEVFVLDGNFVLQYRGRIDNMYSQRLKKHSEVTEFNLRQVLAELVTGRSVSVSATRPIGCSIMRPDRTVAKDGKITYCRDVLPILQKNCQSCHRPGEVGPFSLLTYKQAVNWAQDIKDYTQRREMPPWKISEGVAMHNDRRMSDKEIKTLVAWVDGGTPEGDRKDAPPPREFPKGWQLGTPDLILTPESEFVLGPSGKDVFRCYVLPTKLQEDQYVAAVEVRPGNPQVVHHALLFFDNQGIAQKLEKSAQENEKKNPPTDPHTGEVSKYDRGPGYSSTMGVGFIPRGNLTGWAPGYLTQMLPDGVGMPLPKNSDLVLQIHYHRNGRAEKDLTQIGLYFAKKKVERPWEPGTIAGGVGSGPLRFVFTIPPQEERFAVDGDMWATRDFTLLTIMPHMHLLGKDIKVTMTPPGEAEKTLLTIKEWDYNWQEIYFLKEPIQVKKGTRIHLEAHYDNSDKNPRNPFNPPRRVYLGEYTTNEMCFVFLGGYSDRGKRLLPLLPLSPLGPPKMTR